MKEEKVMKYMKNLYLLMVMAVIACLPSCTDDLGVGNGRNIVEGVPVNVAFKFNVGQSAQVTREASSATAEQTVQTLYVFVFNSDGSKDVSALFDDLKDETGSGTVPEFEVHSGYDKRIYAVANAVSGSGTLTMKQLEAVQTESQLLAVTSTLQESTNVERTWFLMSGKLEPSKEGGQIDIDQDGTIIGSDGIIKLYRVDARITFRVKGENRNSNYSDFIFTADRYWVERIPQGTYVFPQDNDYTTAGYASMSEENQTVVFEGVEDEGANEGYNVFEFYIPENRLTPKARIEANNSEGAENLYALREKRKKPTIPEDERDPNKPGQTEENGAFKYANANSTYVVFRGMLSYTDNTDPSNPKFINANVTYTVHLGNTGTAADANDPDKVNNYNTERNKHYTYTVTVTGINSMEVEVKADTEKRPGVEGDVIIAGADVKAMDSHYGRTHFTLTRGAIKQGLSWAINTPFQRGMKVFVPENHEDNGVITEDLPEDKLRELQTDLSLNDYKWVTFVINKEAIKKGESGSWPWGSGTEDGPVGSNDFAKYPGYRAYDGGSGSNTPAPAFGDETGYHYQGDTQYYAEDVKLYDVNQLINHLYVEANDPASEIFDGTGDDATVAITAFVDEYVYVYDPTQIYYREPVAVGGDESNTDLSLWKRVVNGSERMLHFCTSKEIYSPDGNTSLAESVITISQKPIYTFYDPNNTSVTTAWGTESIMETDRLTVNYLNSLSSSHDNTHDNGRENTLNIIPRYGNLQWTDVLPIASENWGELNNGYRTIWYACLGRNRDLNGDDIVQEDEIRWYIASIDQLTDLWIGQNSLNESAHLYQGVEADGTNRLHVASSTYYDGPNTDERNNSVWVIWAEEGASRGSSYAAAGHKGYEGNKYSDNFEYRCVRNLGLSLNNTNGTAQDYVVTSSGTYNNGSQQYNEYIIDVSWLESNSLRSAYDTGNELPAHNEREGLNRPYKKFAVLRGVSGGRDQNVLYPLSENENNWYYYQEHSVCPEGYRTPNQRELMLMYTSLTDENTEGHEMTWGSSYMTCTGFSFNDNSLYDTSNGEKVHRPGFAYKDNNMQLITVKYTTNRGDETITDYGINGKVRCVRDISD